MEHVIKIKTDTSNMYATIGTFLNLNDAEGSLRELGNNAAEGVFNEIIDILDKNPNGELYDIEQMFNASVTAALVQHQSENHIKDEKDRKLRAFNKAVATARRGFEREVNFRSLGSIHAVEKECTRLNKIEEQEKEDQRLEKAAEKRAKREGISVTEAKEKMKQDKQAMLDAIKGGKAPSTKDESIPKQQFPSDIQKVIDESLELLVKIHNKQPGKAVNILNKLNEQATSSARKLGILGGTLPKAV